MVEIGTHLANNFTGINVIEGSFGSGKTITLQMIAQRLRALNVKHCFVDGWDLGTVTSRFDITEKFLPESITATDFWSFAKRYSHEFVLIFDGLDQISYKNPKLDITTPLPMFEAVRWLGHAWEKGVRNMIVSYRPESFPGRASRDATFGEVFAERIRLSYFSLQPWGAEQRLEYLYGDAVRDNGRMLLRQCLQAAMVPLMR